MGRDHDAYERGRGHAFHVIARAVDVYRAANGMARGAAVDMDDPDVRRDVWDIADDMMCAVWDAYIGRGESSPG